MPWLATVVRRGAALSSASKAFNLAGLKLGLVVGEPAVLELPTTTCLPRRATRGVIAAEAAFREGDEWLDATIATIAANRAAARQLLAGELCDVGSAAQAGYLAWLDCREAGVGDDPAEVFLERGRVALQRGLRFGAPGAASRA